MGWNKCSKVSFTLKNEPAKVIAEIKKEAAKSGTKFNGDEKAGTISNKEKSVRGAYKIVGKKITIQMEEGNFWVDCKYVNDSVKEWFKGK